MCLTDNIWNNSTIQNGRGNENTSKIKVFKIPQDSDCSKITA